LIDPGLATNLHHRHPVNSLFRMNAFYAPSSFSAPPAKGLYRENSIPERSVF
jgi:hypothetical protein